MVNKRFTKAFLHPQEIEVFYIIPSIKRQLSIFMKAAGKRQKDIAKTLQITEATVSQYLSDKRGHQMEFDQEVITEIQKSAKKITDIGTYLYETQRLLKVVRESKALCKAHRMFSKVPAICEPSTVGCTKPAEQLITIQSVHSQPSSTQP